jgi:Type VI secretion system VasI, EvfG, VC_A0118
MRAPLIAIVLSGVGHAACAQPADEGSKMLDACFELVHAADATCSDPQTSAAEREDCRRKASMAQLECLERVFQGRSAGSPAPVMPPRTVSPEMPSRTLSPEITTGIVSPGGPAGRADRPAKRQDTNWIVSETTSPLDYSPLVTAMTRSMTGARDAPDTLAIRCVGQRTEILLHTEGTWGASRPGKVQVECQINDQPLVKQQWNASADGKTVSYANDTIGFLQSLPESARLKIKVLDGTGPGRAATFELAGLDAVLKRIAIPCKWSAADKISSGKR